MVDLLKYWNSVAGQLHKYAALAMGILAATGVTPGTTTDQHLLAVIGVAYAAVVHAFDQLTAKPATKTLIAPVAVSAPAPAPPPVAPAPAAVAVAAAPAA